ncbi:MAG TPA: MaoC/PaaZ C-terminal domain-containing protein [Streptosporangiaceae bacterium]|jgi:acyl dehydratase
MIRGYFEDISPGDQTVTGSRTVTEADIVNFAGVSGDWHPLHVSTEYAGRGPYGERIAHGMLVLSIATGLAPLDPETVLAFYGIDRLRFIRPTRIGDSIHVVSEVTSAEPRDEQSGFIVSDVHIENQDDQLVASATFRMLVRRRALANGAEPAGRPLAERAGA